jgi:hypothetical protein
MAITSASNAIDLAPSRTSLSGLDGINFFLAGMQAGFGLFLAVLLADEKWTQQNIGYVLSVGGLAGLLSQLPSGELLDASRSKRLLVAFGAIVVAVSALVMAGTIATIQKATMIHEEGRTARPPRVLRTNADDRLPVASLGRVEGGDGFVEGSHVADVCPQPTIPDPLDELTQLGAIGYDDEVDSKAARGPRLGWAGNGHQRSSGANHARRPLRDVAAEDIEHQIDPADIF